MWKNAVKELRLSHGWTVKKMSEISGIGPSSISSWERNTGAHIPERYHETLSRIFMKPIEEITWNEQNDFSSIKVHEWPNKEYRKICQNCTKYIWDGGFEAWGRCDYTNKMRRYTDSCTEPKQFSYYDTHFSGDEKFVRSQIKCYCGNCIFCKIRENQYRCTNSISTFYCFAVPHSSICSCWEDSQGNILPKCLHNIVLKEGIIKKRITITRKARKKTMVEIAETLGIDTKEWKLYERGYNAIPIDKLIQFASFTNVSLEWLIGLTDVPGVFSKEEKCQKNGNHSIATVRTVSGSPEKQYNSHGDECKEKLNIDSVKSVRIISRFPEKRYYAIGDEYEQKLKISYRGDVCLTTLSYQDSERKTHLSHVDHYSIGKESAQQLIKTIAHFFRDYSHSSLKHKGYTWRLELIDSENIKQVLSGPMGIQLITENGDLSEIIRKSIWRESAILFDGGNHK